MNITNLIKGNNNIIIYVHNIMDVLDLFCPFSMFLTMLVDIIYNHISLCI